MARTARRVVRVEGEDRAAVARAVNEFVERNGVTINVTRQRRTTRKGDRIMTTTKTDAKQVLVRRTRDELDELLKPLKRKGYKMTVETITIKRTRKGKKVEVPRNIYTLAKNGNVIAIGRGSPRRVLEALEAIAAGKDPSEVTRVASAKTKGREPKQAKTSKRAAKKSNGKTSAEPEPKRDSQMAKAVDEIKAKATKKTNGNGEPDQTSAKVMAAVSKKLGAKVKDFTVKIATDDKNVREVYEGDALVGEIGKVGANRWQVMSPFSPATYDSLTLAKKGLATALLVNAS